MNEQDKYLGEIFESLDSRDDNKRVRVIGKAPATMFRGPGYYYKRVDEFGHVVIGQPAIRISAKTLDTRFRKVSH